MRYFLVLIVALFLSSTSSNLYAQVHVDIGFNLGTQPAWGPTGYDYVDYYYLPDIDVYYSVPLHRYYYNNRGRWISSAYLPSRFHNYNFYNSYKVVVNEREPWRNDQAYREKYSSYKGRHDQQSIRDSRDSKYFINKNHPEHKNWVKQQKHGKENYNGWYKGNNGNGNHKDNNHKNERGNHGHKGK
jgi:hypothetical protein